MNIVKKVNKKVALDICLNIIAVALPIAMLQLLVYPLVAKRLPAEEYGLMLTIYSMWMLLPHSLGNVLNNIKLLKVPDYQRIHDDGDIALLLRQWSAFSSVVVFVAIWVYCGTFSFVHILIGSVVALLIFLKSYLEVGFRIELNYKAVLYNNLLLSFGFVFGFFVFCFTNVWENIFLFGYLFSGFFCVYKTNLLYERPKKTALFFSIKKDAYSLVFSVLIKNLTNYADKMVLYPLIGGVAVSIYYTATILGKITGMLAAPINSVVLSYISRWDQSKANIFSKVLALGSVVCFAGYLGAVLLARPLIGLLFPQWIEAVMAIIPLTTATIMLNILMAILNPFVLKYCKMQWQISINLVGSFVYFGSALLFWNFMGLKGFCIGTIIGALIKLIFTITVYYRTIKEI